MVALKRLSHIWKCSRFNEHFLNSAPFKTNTGVCLRADVSPTSQALCDDVVTVLTVFCEKLESVER